MSERFNSMLLQSINAEPLAIEWPIEKSTGYLSSLSSDERAVYLAAFGAFSGNEGPGVERAEAAAARGKRAVRWFRELKEQGKL